MKNVIRKFSNLIMIGGDLNQQNERCCKKEMSYEEVIKRYEELCSK